MLSALGWQLTSPHSLIQHSPGKDVEWLAQLTKLPFLVKGILRVDDALRAVDHGASGIILSNHGARQLDRTPATISVLPEIVDALAGAVEVYVDGGIRRGTDALKRWLMAPAVSL